jgi:hypothetical protein
MAGLFGCGCGQNFACTPAARQGDLTAPLSAAGRVTGEEPDSLLPPSGFISMRWACPDQKDAGRPCAFGIDGFVVLVIDIDRYGRSLATSST